MEAFLAAFLESLLPSAAEAGGMASYGEMVPPTAMEGLGSTIGGMGNQAIAPVMDAYKTFTNPNATSGDMLQGAYKYAFNPKTREDEMMSAPQMRMGGGMGGGMGTNYVGGIPSLLQGYGGASSGLLPYIGGR